VVWTGGGADTDRIAPYLFRSIRSDAAIPDNPAKTLKLKQALLRCSKPIIEARQTRTPRVAERISGVTYSLSSNPLDLRSMRLDFENTNEATVRLQFTNGHWIAPVGLDGKRRFAPIGPYGLSVGTIGQWLSESEFLLDIDTIANVNHFVFDIRIDGDRAHLTMNEITGEVKDIAVEGVALK